MDDKYMIESILLYIAIIVVDAILFGFGTSIKCINQAELEKKVQEGDKKSIRINRIIKSQNKFFNILQIMITIMGIIVGAVILRIGKDLIRIFLTEGLKYSLIPAVEILIWIVSGAILVIFLLSFGMVIPKKLSSKNPEKWVYGLLPIVSIISIPAYLLAFVIYIISTAVLKIFGIDLNEQNEEVTEEEIMSMVNEGHEKGVLLESEAEMITNIFQFDEKNAADIMTHRKNIVAIEDSLTLREVVSIILEENYSRFPVYRENIDDIIGILYLRDVLSCYDSDSFRGKAIIDIEGLIREANFVPETKKVNDLFKEMQSNKNHMEIVIDEYGQTAGLVTMEDILEEIVGNIFDEYDEEKQLIIAQPDGTYYIDGVTPLEDVEEILGIKFEKEEYETMNGFLISKLNKIPQQGEILEVIYDNYSFRIIDVEDKMIHMVRVEKLESDEKPE